MSYTLQTKWESFVTDEFSRGGYDSPSAVLEKGLHLLQEKRREQDDVLKAEIQKGIDQIERGEYIDINGDAELRRFLDEL